jgi:hypothetical protein
MNPPTWAKNATPLPFAEALNSPKLASMSWYKNQSPRKIHDPHSEVGHDQEHIDDREPSCGDAV